MIENEAQLREALSAGAESILLEDMPVEPVRQLVRIARGMRRDCIVEISGDISLERVSAYAESGVDYIAPVGLVAGAPSVAMRLLVEELGEK